MLGGGLVVVIVVVEGRAVEAWKLKALGLGASDWEGRSFRP